MTGSPLVAIIDDDLGMRLAIDALIRSLDYRTAIFASAEEFLTSRLARTCDCIISDVRMDGMSGIDLVARLNSAVEGGASPPPTILMSAFTDTQMENAAMTAGAICLLKKPFNAEALIAHIETLVASSPI
ncbi:response regulator transcription factor [Rhizobium sp. WYJ-E13]|uniref:response regulator transcription factor n=1 Tax=Rhizobium sp. WYJ-E13 TaxID=2849093 RepID=UPI001C1EA271|nr:response regulator [Rhizobium sp. WYJ-E13]QWW72583.1 response regulator [Rhizobium sp. WYJ-E13]